MLTLEARFESVDFMPQQLCTDHLTQRAMSVLLKKQQ